MASDPQSTLGQIQLNDYIAGGVYLVTPVTEKTLDIGVRDVSRAPLLWFTVRDSGAIIWSQVVSMTTGVQPRMIHNPSEGTAIFLSLVWGNTLYLIVIDWMFILRVYAMYNRSKIVVYILLLVYVPITICLIVFIGIANNPKIHLVWSVPVLASRVTG
ncbi:hypothetical protein BU15DRAFT_62847 [Melanogaster broomeanus]|nr:hypothetical protein BU15DRAFT_62847 [Melanogaster broomeanus]